MLRRALLIWTIIVGTLGNSYEDKRCRCICPSLAEVFNGTMSTDRKIFNTDLPANKCNCVGVIIPRMGKDIQDREQEFCSRCECKYETRNTTVIKVVVITVIWLLTLLVVYAIFLTCLDPLTRIHRVRRIKDQNSEEAHLLMHGDEDED